MRFRSKGKPRGVIPIADQRRLTLVIAGVGLLALLFSVAGRRDFWTAITGPQTPTGVTGSERNVSEDLLGVPRLEPDEFTVGAARTSGETAPLDLKSLLDRDEAARLERLSQGDPRAATTTGPERVPASVLQPVRDDIIGVHSTEADAYFASLRMAEMLARRAGAAAAADGRYALFMDSPDSCRGQAWTVRGTLRRMSRLQSDANSFGVKTLYDAWISLPDSGNQLVHVVAVAADAGLPLGDTNLQSAPAVQLTGYYFKREGYVRAGADQQGDVALTPLLLAGRIQKYDPAPAMDSGAAELTPWLGWLSLLVCVCVVAVIWQFQISDRVFRRTRTHQLTTLPVRVSFDGVDAVTISETLRQMEQQTSAAEDGSRSGSSMAH